MPPKTTQQQLHQSGLKLVQLNNFNYLLEELYHQGCNTDRLLRNSQLHLFDLENTDNYVPVSCMYQLFQGMQRQEGIGDFLTVFKDTFDIAGCDNLGQMLLSAKDLLGMIELGMCYSHLTCHSIKDRLEINGVNSKFSVYFRDQNSEGLEVLVITQLGLLISIYKQICGKNWAPKEIHLPLNICPNLSELLPANHKTRIKLNQPSLSLIFPTELLSTKIPTGPSEDKNSPTVKFHSVQDLISHLLENSKAGHLPTLALMAEMLSTSERSLQRKLKMEDTSYRKLVDRWRFNKAITLLADPNLSVKEVGWALGYQHVHNFYHAFERWTSTTPVTYRSSL